MINIMRPTFVSTKHSLPTSLLTTLLCIVAFIDFLFDFGEFCTVYLGVQHCSL